MMMKVVLKLEFADEKMKQKAMKKVSFVSGIESMAMDPNDKKLTVTGDIDPVSVVGKVRKLCQTEIVSVGPVKEPEQQQQQQHYYNYNYAPSQQYVQPAEPSYYARIVEDNPNACVIC